MSKVKDARYDLWHHKCICDTSEIRFCKCSANLHLHCKVCFSGYMVPRKGQRGLFWGCNMYDKKGCEFTMSWGPPHDSHARKELMYLEEELRAKEELKKSQKEGVRDQHEIQWLMECICGGAKNLNSRECFMKSEGGCGRLPLCPRACGGMLELRGEERKWWSCSNRSAGCYFTKKYLPHEHIKRVCAQEATLKKASKQTDHTNVNEPEQFIDFGQYADQREASPPVQPFSMNDTKKPHAIKNPYNTPIKKRKVIENPYNTKSIRLSSDSVQGDERQTSLPPTQISSVETKKPHIINPYSTPKKPKAVIKNPYNTPSPIPKRLYENMTWKKMPNTNEKVKVSSSVQEQKESIESSLVSPASVVTSNIYQSPSSEEISNFPIHHNERIEASLVPSVNVQDKNTELCVVMQKLAQKYLDQGDVYRSRAYNNLVHTLRHLPFKIDLENVDDIGNPKNPSKVRGIGKGITSKIKEFLETGKLQALGDDKEK